MAKNPRNPRSEAEAPELHPEEDLDGRDVDDGDEEEEGPSPREQAKRDPSVALYKIGARGHYRDGITYEEGDEIIRPKDEKPSYTWKPLNANARAAYARFFPNGAPNEQAGLEPALTEIQGNGNWNEAVRQIEALKKGQEKIAEQNSELADENEALKAELEALKKGAPAPAKMPALPPPAPAAEGKKGEEREADKKKL